MCERCLRRRRRRRRQWPFIGQDCLVGMTAVSASKRQEQQHERPTRSHRRPLLMASAFASIIHLRAPLCLLHTSSWRIHCTVARRAHHPSWVAMMMIAVLLVAHSAITLLGVLSTMSLCVYAHGLLCRLASVWRVVSNWEHSLEQSSPLRLRLVVGGE